MGTRGSWWRNVVAGMRFADDPVPVLLPEPARSEVLAILRSEGLVSAVRRCRELTHLDLVSATRAVRALGEATGLDKA